jgi:alpha-beta hydrolase superfamily lysophospholipase
MKPSRGILVIIHGLNEHSGRYLHFAEQLTACGFGVYAMDWIGKEHCFGYSEHAYAT